MSLVIITGLLFLNTTRIPKKTLGIGGNRGDQTPISLAISDSNVARPNLDSIRYSDQEIVNSYSNLGSTIQISLHNDLEFIGQKVAPVFYPEEKDLDDIKLFNFRVPGYLEWIVPCRDTKPLVGKLINHTIKFPFDEHSLSFDILNAGRIKTNLSFNGEVYKGQFHAHWNRNDSNDWWDGCTGISYRSFKMEPWISGDLNFFGEIDQTFYVKTNPAGEKILNTKNVSIEISEIAPSLGENLGNLLENFINSIIYIANALDSFWAWIQNLFNFGSGEGIYSFECSNLTTCAEILIKKEFKENYQDDLEKELKDMVNDSIGHSLSVGGDYHGDMIDLNYTGELRAVSSAGHNFHGYFDLKIDTNSYTDSCSELLEKASIPWGTIANPYHGDLSVKFPLGILNDMIYLLGKAGLFCQKIPLDSGSSSPLSMGKLSIRPNGKYTLNPNPANQTIEMSLPIIGEGNSTTSNAVIGGDLLILFKFKESCRNGLDLVIDDVNLVNTVGSIDYVVPYTGEVMTFDVSSIVDLSINALLDGMVGLIPRIPIIPRITNLYEKKIYLHLNDVTLNANSVIPSFKVETTRPFGCNGLKGGGSKGGGSIGDDVVIIGPVDLDSSFEASSPALNIKNDGSSIFSDENNIRRKN